jgi:hypothetical protein
VNPRRELTAAVLANAAGAGLAVWAASRTWVVEVVARAAPQPPLVTPHSGGSLTPLLPALALVALAAAGGLLATRGVARLAVGAVAGLAGIAVAVEAVDTANATAGVSLIWPVLCGLGAVLTVAASVLTLARGRRWPAMGARYERVASAAHAQSSAAAMWDAIERGHDPTKLGPDSPEDHNA